MKYVMLKINSNMSHTYRRIRQILHNFTANTKVSPYCILLQVYDFFLPQIQIK